MGKTARFTLLDERPEIRKHGNTKFCPLSYEVIPAWGCAFKCVYCNVYSMLEEDGHEPIKVFENYAKVLDETIVKHQENGEDVAYYFSPKTEILQPALLETGITKQLLEVFKKRSARYFMVTKGGTPPDEIMELLKDTAQNGQVMVSYGMPNERFREILEPGAPPLAARFEFAKKCMENGIHTLCVIEPILPLKDLLFIENIIKKFHSIGVDHFSVDFARITKTCLEKITAAMPEIKEELENLYYSENATEEDFYTGPYQRVHVKRYSPCQDYLREKYTWMKEVAKKYDSTISICNAFGLHEINTEAFARGFWCFGILRRKRVVLADQNGRDPKDSGAI